MRDLRINLIETRVAQIDEFYFIGSVLFCRMIRIDIGVIPVLGKLSNNIGSTEFQTVEKIELA